MTKKGKQRHIAAMPVQMLTRERIIEGLNRLGRLAEAEEVQLEVCIYGGCAMVLAYGARTGTRDIDAIIRPSEIAKRLANKVAEELHLQEDWLNDEVRRFLSDQGTFAPLEIQELEATAKRHLKITRPSASYLLAMKCMACRPALPGHPRDEGDIKFLIRKMGITTVQQVDEHIERFYPNEALDLKSRPIVERIIKEVNESKK